MLIPRGILCTLIAGACAAESIEWSRPTAEVNKTRSPPPILLSARKAVSQEDVRSNESSQDEGPLAYAERRLPAPADDGLEARQATPIRPPTVFSTTYITSTVTAFAGEPVTSTIFETFTVTSSLAPQKRTIPWTFLSSGIQSHLDVSLQAPDDPTTGPNRKRRQNSLSTVTSVIYMISRTVVTVAPTIGTTIPLTVTIATASDGSTMTLQPSTTSQLPSTVTTTTTATSISTASSQSSQTSSPTGSPATSILNQGAIAGGVLGSVFAVALLLAIILCCIQRRRRQRQSKDAHTRNAAYSTTLNSNNSLDPDQGTLIHHESFHVGASPPASVAPSASEQEQQQPVALTPPLPTSQMKQVLPAVDDTSRQVWRPGGITRRQSGRAGRIWLVSDDNEEGSSSGSSSSNGSGFDSNEAQPPSPVASSDIFGPYNSIYRQTRDTWASSADMSLSFATPRNLTMLGSDFEGPSRISESMEGDAMWRDEDEQSGRESWSPSIPERSQRRSRNRAPGEKAVRFQETLTTPTRRSSGSGGKSFDGSGAFL